MQLDGLFNTVFIEFLSVFTSILLLVLVYFQYRIQKKEYQPDLDVPRVAHHLSVHTERESPLKKSDIDPDEILFEVSNLGNGTASRVHVESQISTLYRGDQLSSDINSLDDDSAESNNSKKVDESDGSPPTTTNPAKSFAGLPFLKPNSVPRVLSLDTFREDVYHSNWKDNAEATIPSGRVDIGYLIHLHVRKPNGQANLNEILSKDYPEKTVFRLKLVLAYQGPLSRYDYTDQILDFVIYPGVCSTLQQAMEVGIPYNKYKHMDREQAILNANIDLEEFERNRADQ